MDEKLMADPNNIREMNIETDLDQVKKIWLYGAKRSHPLIRKDFWDSRLSSFRTETENSKERYVYKDEKDKIRAFITVRQDGYIFELYVDFRKEDFRRKGIGTALFETLKGENPKFPQLKRRYWQFTSSVYAHNYESIAWHIKNKFIITAIRFCPDTGLPKFDMKWERIQP